jgi:hypothetical protein
MKKILFLSVIVVFFAREVSAQITSCAQTLRLARSTYEQGRLHELPDLLKSCLESGFTTTEKVEAYKWLTLAYIYLEEPEKADEMMLNILQTDHYFEINESVDPAEFIALYNTFRTKEIYRLGLKLGANASQPNLISSNNASTASSKYQYGFGFSGSIVGEIPFYKKLTFNPEIQLNLLGFKNKATSVQSTGDFVTTMNQKLSYVSIPLVVQYQIWDNIKNKKKRIKPYVLAGVAPDYLFGSTRSLNESRAGYPPVTGSYNTLSSMNKVNISAVIGAGFRMRVGGGYFVTEVRYKYGFKPVTTSKTTYSNEIPVFGDKYADGIYYINSLSITVGYVQNFFNPKKLKIRK